MRFPWAIAVLATGVLAAATHSGSVTFHKDIVSILQKNCQVCHRPGEAAPMPLITYAQARPWAKAIREAVLTRRMPPWFADPQHGKFANERSLSPAEIDALVGWIDGGAPEGNPKDSPGPREFVDGWNIGQPDAVFEMPNEFAVPGSGTIEYQYIVIPTGFTEDKWIERAEARPGNRAVVHHVIAFVREPGSRWMREALPGVPYVPKRGSRQQDPQTGQRPRREGSEEDRASGRDFLVGLAPGSPPAIYKPGQGKLIKAGSDLVFQMHYTANGKEGTDRTKVGIIFAKNPPTERIATLAVSNGRFVIPPGAGNHRVDSQMTLQEDSTLVSLLPHMHLRGKSFEYRAIYPTGESEILLRVPKYSFNWQLWYHPAKELVLPKGTRIECMAHFDNSPNNPSNPDATVEVRWGDQSWEEMMIGWMEVAIDANKSPESLRRQRPAAGGDD